jgi:TPR repeat protein
LVKGDCYAQGLGGKERNSEIALKHYRTAADKGDAIGLYCLGLAYKSGLLGLQRDGAEAAWLIMRALEARFDRTVVQSLTTYPENWSADFWQNLQCRLAEGTLLRTRGRSAQPCNTRCHPAARQDVSQAKIPGNHRVPALVGERDSWEETGTATFTLWRPEFDFFEVRNMRQAAAILRGRIG